MSKKNSLTFGIQNYVHLFLHSIFWLNFTSWILKRCFVSFKYKHTS